MFSKIPVEPKNAAHVDKVAVRYMSLFDLEALKRCKARAGLCTADIYREVERQFPREVHSRLYEKWEFPTGMEDAAGTLVARLRDKMEGEERDG